MIKLLEYSKNPEWQLRLMILGGSISEYIKVISELGIVDSLSEKPQKINCFIDDDMKSEKLIRLMNIGVALNLFETNSSEEYSLTEMGQSLKSNVPHSLRNYAILKGQKWGRIGLSGLKDSLYHKESAFELAHGMGIFDYMERENLSHQYHESLREISSYHDSFIIQNYDFSYYLKVMDIGGGMGSLLAEILKSNINLRGIHYDQKSASKKAESSKLFSELLDRCDFISGDFFKDIPEVCDLYILKTILHDWDDANASIILNNIRRVIPKNGKLLIIEILPKNKNHTEYSIMDLEMLIFYGGKERTNMEYDKLLTSTGFKLQRVISTNADISILEVCPV